MAEGKKGFVLYTNKIYLLDALTDKQAGILFKHIFNYVNDKYTKENEDSLTDPVVKMAWLSFKADLKEDLKKWKNISERNRANGQKGGRPRNQEAQENPNNPMGSLETQENPEKPKKADIDIDIDSVSVIDINKENNTNKISVKEKPTNSRFYPPTLEEIKSYCDERNNLVDPERFYDFYSAKGWMVGKNKMKDWKAAVRTWEKEAGFRPDENDDGGFMPL